MFPMFKYARDEKKKAFSSNDKGNIRELKNTLKNDLRTCLFSSTENEAS